MAARERTYTVEAFEAFVDLPENADRLFEYIGGEIVEVPSNSYSSKIAITIATYIRMFMFENDMGHVTGEQGGYVVMGERYAPDVAFISYERQPILSSTGYNPIPPDIAVEVVSSTRKSESQKLTIKLSNYLAAGTMVWIVRLESKAVEIHQAGKAAQSLDETGIIDGGEILPGFTLKVSDIFK